MQLYWSSASPFVRKVSILLHEAGAWEKVGKLRAGGNAVNAGSMPLAQNPLGKVPVLVRDDGPALYDSRVICRYLDDRFGLGLYPAAPRLWDTLTLEATGDGISEAGVLIVYESRLRPEAIRHAPWVEGQWAKVIRALDAVESRWTGHLSGPFDIGQVALAAALGHLDFRHAARPWRDGRPRLAEWFESVSSRPSLAATQPTDAP